MTKSYLAPVGQWIGEGPESAKLYELERFRNDYINRAAKELAKLLGHTPNDYWYKTMPEALLSILDSFDRQAALLAAEAFITKEELKKGGGR